jgi:hypothetical protein
MTMLLTSSDLPASQEQLEEMVDTIRQALRPGSVFYQTLEAQPDQCRMLPQLRDATKLNAALAAIRPLIAANALRTSPLRWRRRQHGDGGPAQLGRVKGHRIIPDRLLAWHRLVRWGQTRPTSDRISTPSRALRPTYAE